MSDPTSDVSDAMCSYLSVLTAVRAPLFALGFASEKGLRPPLGKSMVQVMYLREPGLVSVHDRPKHFFQSIWRKRDLGKQKRKACGPVSFYLRFREGHFFLGSLCKAPAYR